MNEWVCKNKTIAYKIEDRINKLDIGTYTCRRISLHILLFLFTNAHGKNFYGFHADAVADDIPNEQAQTDLYFQHVSRQLYGMSAAAAAAACVLVVKLVRSRPASAHQLEHDAAAAR